MLNDECSYFVTFSLGTLKFSVTFNLFTLKGCMDERVGFCQICLFWTFYGTK